MAIQWQIKTFNSLTTNELYDILKLRIDVFVVEQSCYYADLDNFDKHPKTLHLFCYQAGHIAAYLRILPPQTSYREYASIGRVVVAQQARGKGLAHQMLEYALALCEVHHEEVEIKISAQEHLTKFYQQHGFERVTDVYLEDNIPHVGMLNKVS